ncbi:MAG: ABC transporter permease [Erysipelothrix sp.]
MNLRYIEVSANETSISKETLQEIKNIENVDSAFYNNLSIASIETGDQGESILILGVDSESASVILNKRVQMKDDNIFLNKELEEIFCNTQEFDLSFNVKVTDSSGYRSSVPINLESYYDQPKLSSWNYNVALVSQNTQKNIMLSQLGIIDSEYDELEFGREKLVVIVDDTEHVNVVAQNIESLGNLSTWYSLKANEELPVLAKLIHWGAKTITLLLMIVLIVVIRSSSKNQFNTKSKEVAILKTSGYSQNEITIILLGEYFIIWVLALMIASLLTVFISFTLNKVLFHFGYTIQVIMKFQYLLLSGVVIFGTVLFTVLETIIKLTRISIVEVFRYEKN